MKEFLAYLKLIRYTNLIIIVLTQYFFRHFILLPLYRLEDVVPPMGELTFFLLVLSTVLIAAAGYAINDYFDMRVDHINKPDKMILGKIIPRRMAILIHGFFTGAGILLSFIAAFMVGSWKLGLVSVIITYMLWRYSHRYKASFITGNFVIALFSAFVMFIVWLYEFYAQLNTGQAIILWKGLLNTFLFLYLFFAFLTSFIREIVKDIEDIEGDRRVGCETIPIKLGIPKAKKVIYSMIGLMLLFLGLMTTIVFLKPHYNLLGFYLAFLILLFAYMLSLVIKAKEKQDYSFLSMYIKIVMLAGIFTMQLVYILLR